MTSMVTDEAPPVSAPAVPSVAGAPLTAGAALQAARRARGLHIAALAAMLKVPQAKLEALEADRIQDLPDATFARALATAMCRALKTDAAPVLALLPKGNEAGLERVTRGLNQPFRDRSGREEGLSLELLKRPVVLGTAGLLLAAALVYLVPGAWLTAWTERADTTAGSAATTTTTSVPSQPMPEPTPVVQEPVQSLAPSASTPAEPLPAPLAQAVPADAAAPLRVRTSADSWVEVVDAKGQVLLSRVLHAGEQAELGGQLPLRLRIGNVAGTELSYKGKPVDLVAQARDNVARFELN
ncbi:helix-turn-helix domain-containing protein [Paucibacter soli]|uniref:helix-turn-helix domain-containing protein n=1 Tax=Paucibacter soli TaxID=3133433 RepID=UPI003099362F